MGAPPTPTPTAAPYAHPLAEVAQLTGLTERRLLEGCRRGEIPHSFYRGVRVMTPEDVREFLAGTKVRPEPAPDADELDKRREAARRRAANRTAGRRAA